VFRIAVLSLLLTFAVAPHAPLLCAIWCHPDEATDVCHPREPSPSAIVKGGDTCTGVVANVSTFIREDVRRTAALSEPGPFVVVRHSPFAEMAPEARAIAGDERTWAIETRRLHTVLRL
jgi:hypothetical protein